jgi:hypothetical protein
MLATEESSTTMKVANITDAAIIHGFAAGFQSRCSSSALRIVISDTLNGRSHARTRIVCQ